MAWPGDVWGGSWGHTWAGSWGLTFEAAQDEEVQGSGGPDANSRGRTGRTETIEDEEHLEKQAAHGRRIYAKDIPRPVQVLVTDDAEPLAPTPTWDDAAVLTEDLHDAAESFDALSEQLDRHKRNLNEDEEILLLLLAA